MKFSEILHIEQQWNNKDVSKEDARNRLLTAYIEQQNRINEAKNKPFIFFYEDIIAKQLTVDFETVLTPKDYLSAEGDARCCLELCNNFKSLSSWVITAWLPSALKFVDNIVLHYIQNSAQLKVQKYKNAGVEKSRYIQLSKQADKDIAFAGSLLANMYELRNKLEHRTITHDDGTQEILRPQRNKVRREVAKLYPRILMGLLAYFEPEIS